MNPNHKLSDNIPAEVTPTTKKSNLAAKSAKPVESQGDINHIQEAKGSQNLI